jgi:hypothetical protein
MGRTPKKIGRGSSLEPRGKEEKIKDLMFCAAASPRRGNLNISRQMVQKISV